MFNFFSNIFRGEKLNKDLVLPLINTISTEKDYDKAKTTLDTLLPNIPLDNYYSTNIYEEIFSSFDYNQINTFSNNLCLTINSQMKDKLGQLNYTAELLLNFLTVIYTKYKTIRDLISKSYTEIIDNKKDIKEIISNSFPFNIFILCVNALTNDDFFFRQDIFQRECDKFDFSFRITNMIFFIVHYCDNNPTKSSLSSIEFLDTTKLFLLNTKENLFISKKKQLDFLVKLYNTSIHNFDTLINGREGPNIGKKNFEKFIFMNIYLLWYFLCDRNRNIMSDITSNLKSKNTFNIKTITIVSSLIGNENKNNENKNNDIIINDLINEYNLNYSIAMKNELLNTNDKFMLFIQNVYSNIDNICVMTKTLIKIIILYQFDIYSDLSEMICLKKELIGKILEKTSPNNAYDLMILYTLSKSVNFYITIKQSKLTLEQMFLNCIINYLEQKKNNKQNFTFSLYYSLLTAKNISTKLKFVSNICLEKMIEFENYLYNLEINTDFFFDNIMTLTIFYQIEYGIITSIDAPARYIYYKLKNGNDAKNIIMNYNEYYKNNFEYDNHSKNMWEDFSKITKKYMELIDKILSEIEKEGLDLKLSSEQDIINLLNRESFKENEKINDIMSNKEHKEIFHSETEKFIISSIYANELFKVFSN